MTDQQMTMLCAEAMGIPVSVMPGMDGPALLNHQDGDDYNPLHNDAQAMALVKGQRLSLSFNYFNQRWRVEGDEGSVINEDLNRAIVQAVAKMQASKKG
jgi:hypothetical protein